MPLRKSDGPSFFDLLTKQAALLVSAVDLLGSMLGSLPLERVALRDKLHEIEHEADVY